MPERRLRPGIPPHTWPRQLPPPHDPELPVRVIGWIREVLPSEEWRVEALRRRPSDLVTQCMFAIDRLVESLRESHREAVKHFSHSLDPDEMRSLLDAHAVEAQRLTDLREQLGEVLTALTAMGAAGLRTR